jgi:hypothetical protein
MTTDETTPASEARRGDAHRVLTVGDLIRVLECHPPELPIYLADWNEEYAEDWPLVVEEIHVLDNKLVHDKTGRLLFEQPRRLCLGGKGNGGKEFP